MRHRTAFTLIELLVVIGICSLLFAMLWPAVNAAKQAQRRSDCTYHLKQISIGFHNYHDTCGLLPSAYVTDEEGQPLYSWRISILPFVEQQNLHKVFRLDEAWNGEHNLTLFDQRPSIYTCPQQYRFEGQPGDCPYGMIVGPHTVSDGPRAVKLAEITDGTSNTILVAETRKHIPWSSPTDISFERLFGD